MDKAKAQCELVPPRPMRLNVNAEVPTPFVVPWSWYIKQRLYWQLPKLLCVTVTADGKQDTARYSALVDEDPQFGLRASINLTSALEKYAGYHLLSLRKVSQAELHFTLSRWTCSCSRRSGSAADRTHGARDRSDMKVAATRAAGVVDSTADGGTRAAAGPSTRIRSGGSCTTASTHSTAGGTGCPKLRRSQGAATAAGQSRILAKHRVGGADAPTSEEVGVGGYRYSSVSDGGSSSSSSSDSEDGDNGHCDEDDRDVAAGAPAPIPNNPFRKNYCSCPCHVWRQHWPDPDDSRTSEGDVKEAEPERARHRGGRDMPSRQPPEDRKWQAGSGHRGRRPSNSLQPPPARAGLSRQPQQARMGVRQPPLPQPPRPPLPPMTLVAATVGAGQVAPQWPQQMRSHQGAPPCDIVARDGGGDFAAPGAVTKQPMQGASLAAAHPQTQHRSSRSTSGQADAAGTSGAAGPQPLSTGPDVTKPEPVSHRGAKELPQLPQPFALRTEAVLQQPQFQQTPRHTVAMLATEAQHYTAGSKETVIDSDNDNGSGGGSRSPGNARGLPVDHVSIEETEGRPGGSQGDQMEQMDYPRLPVEQPLRSRGTACGSRSKPSTGILVAVMNSLSADRKPESAAAAAVATGATAVAMATEAAAVAVATTTMAVAAVTEAATEAAEEDKQKQKQPHEQQQSSPHQDALQSGTAAPTTAAATTRARRAASDIVATELLNAGGGDDGGADDGGAVVAIPGAATRHGPDSCAAGVHVSPWQLSHHDHLAALNGSVSKQDLGGTLPPSRNVGGGSADVTGNMPGDGAECANTGGGSGFHIATKPLAESAAVLSSGQPNMAGESQHAVALVTRQASVGLKPKRPREAKQSEEEEAREERHLQRARTSLVQGQGVTAHEPARLPDLAATRGTEGTGGHLPQPLTLEQRPPWPGRIQAPTKLAAGSGGRLAATKWPSLALTLPGRPICRPSLHVSPLECKTPDVGIIIKGTQLVMDPGLLQGRVGFLRLFVERDGYLDGNTAARCVKVEKVEGKLVLTRLPSHAQNCIFVGWGALSGGTLVLRVRSRLSEATNCGIRVASSTGMPPQPAPASIATVAAAAINLATQLDRRRQGSGFRTPAMDEAEARATPVAAPRAWSALSFPPLGKRIPRCVRVEDLLESAPSLSSELEEGPLDNRVAVISGPLPAAGNAAA